MPQFSQSLYFDFMDASRVIGKMLSDFLQSVFRTGIPEPKTHLDDFSSRGVSVAKTSSVISRRFYRGVSRICNERFFDKITAEMRIFSSSPIGVSSEIGSCAIFKTFAL